MNLKHRSYIDKQKGKKINITKYIQILSIFYRKSYHERKKKKKITPHFIKKKKKLLFTWKQGKEKNAFSLLLNSNQHIKYLFLTLF